MKRILPFMLMGIILLYAASCKEEEKQSSLIPTATQSTDAKENADKPKEKNEPNYTSPDVKTRTLSLYFVDSAAQYLRQEERNIGTDDEAIEWAIIYELIKGPETQGLKKAINGNVGILSIETKKGVCTVDLTKEFVDANTGGSTKETFAIYSLVNSLCALDSVDKVKINIEGNTEAEFGSMLLDAPLEENKKLVDET